MSPATLQRALRGLRWSGLAVLVGIIAALSWVLIVYPDAPHSGSHESFVLEIPDGASATHIAEALERSDAIGNARVFKLFLRLTGADHQLRSGSILLAGNLRPSDIVQRIARGRGRVPRRVMIPEGSNRFDIARRLEEAEICPAGDFLIASADPYEGAATHEGYLFPDTYDFVEGTPAGEIVQRMRDNGRRRLTALLEQHRPAVEALREELGYGPQELLTLASVVEKEAAVAAERPTIAGVFLNRLRSETFRPRHRLQADPTVSYGCLAQPELAASCAGFEGTITRAMLDDGDNPYNTYRHGGLPPGPISNPGIEAIRAVLRPEAHDYLYFVARGAGRHDFSATLQEHNAAVRRFRGTSP